VGGIESRADLLSAEWIVTIRRMQARRLAATSRSDLRSEFELAADALAMARRQLSPRGALRDRTVLAKPSR
jgi:hypothetical protein